MTKELSPIPVIVISGFLGSGKTSIDQQLLRAHRVPLTTLVGGCLCCQVLGALTPLLKNLRMAWEKQPTFFERIIIETSGVANPEPLLDTLLRERWLSKRYSLHNIITTLSATLELDSLAQPPEVQAQLAWADRIVITQTDLVGPEKLATLNAYLQQLVPSATQQLALHGATDWEQLLSQHPRFRPLPASSTVAEHNFRSISLQLPQAIMQARIEQILSALLAKFPQQLLRLKGMVFTPGDPQPLLLQGATGYLYPSTRLPLRESDDGIGRLVLIGNGNIELLAEELMAALRSV